MDKLLKRMVGLEGFEPPTHGLGNRCSIHLSYRPEGAGLEHSPPVSLKTITRVRLVSTVAKGG